MENQASDFTNKADKASHKSKWSLSGWANRETNLTGAVLMLVAGTLGQFPALGIQLIDAQGPLAFGNDDIPTLCLLIALLGAVIFNRKIAALLLVFGIVAYLFTFIV